MVHPLVLCTMKMKFFFIGLVALLSSCGSQNQENFAPEIEADLIDGTPFKLSELRALF